MRGWISLLALLLAPAALADSPRGKSLPWVDASVTATSTASVPANLGAVTFRSSLRIWNLSASNVVCFSFTGTAAVGGGGSGCAPGSTPVAPGALYFEDQPSNVSPEAISLICAGLACPLAIKAVQGALLAPVGFTPQVSAYSGVVHQIDGAQPVVTTITGTQGIKLDTVNGGVANIMDTAASEILGHGYGEVNYVSSGSPCGGGYFSDKSTNYHTGYDGITFATADGNQLFASPNNPWTMTFVERQTATGGNDFIKAQGSQTVNGPNTSIGLYVDPTGSDGSLHFNQNDMQGTVKSETSGATTALNQWVVMTIQSLNGKIIVRRNGVTTMTTNPTSVVVGATAEPGIIGGWGATTQYFEFLNNSNTDLAFMEIAQGAESNALMNAENARLAGACGLGTMATVSDGPSAYVAPDAADTTVSDAITSPNFPISDTAPTKPGGGTPTLPGLTLGGSPVSLAYWDFTTGGTTGTRALLDQQVYYTSIFGNLLTTAGDDGIEGDGWNYGCSYYNTCSNLTRSRTYPTTSQWNLINFNGANGVNLGVICAKNNTTAGCLPGNVHGPNIRFPTIVQNGDIIHYVMRGHQSNYWYAGFVLYSAAEKTPGAGGNPYSAPASVTYDNCYGEDDGTDDYWPGGIPVGTQLKSGVVPRHSYFTNTSNGCYTNRPKTTFAANGSHFSYFANPSGLPYWETLGSTVYDGFHDYVIWLKSDGSNLIEYYRDGVRYAEQYYEHVTTAGNTVPGWSIQLANQTVPNFNAHSTITPNDGADGGTINGGAWSTDYKLVEVIRGGTITGESGTEDANGTTSTGGDNISLSYY